MAILKILDDGEWHKRTAEIGKLSPWVLDYMFGRVKKHYGIEYRWVGRGPGSYVEWRRVPPSGTKMRPDFSGGAA